MNIKLIVAYDGTSYKGWQKTGMGPSIENELQVALERILQNPVKLQAASRTDAGVHAHGQVVNFLTEKEGIDLGKLCIGLNSLLPKDIVVFRADLVADSFHPTLDAKRKEYHYFLCHGHAQMPHHRLYSWHYPHFLDVSLMRQAAGILCGKHDFSSFCNFKKNAAYSHYERIVDRIEIVQIEENRLRFSITGSNFLYKMVRNLVGTIVYVGRGKIKLEEVSGVLQAQDRTQAGVTTPAHGLFLHSVVY